jgi:DNA-binding MarR family transcriptional regulator
MEESQLNEQVMNSLIELIKTAGTLGQAIGAEFGLNGSEAMALHKIDGPVPMKELASRLGCDASFVTAIADSLERHGLARREPSLRDRRSKIIVLTEHGMAVRDQITSEVTARMPWCNALDVTERQCLLGHMGKMLGRVPEGGDRVTTAAPVSS